jgi:hypothetical protein
MAKQMVVPIHELSPLRLLLLLLSLRESNSNSKNPVNNCPQELPGNSLVTVSNSNSFEVLNGETQPTD